MSQSLNGLVIVSFESRLRAETEQLITKHGGRVVQAPALVEVPLGDASLAQRFVQALWNERIDVLLLLTGTGTQLLVAAATGLRPRAEVAARLARVALVCRGPKPVRVLRSLGVRPALIVPEPSTWRDLLVALDAKLPVSGRNVYVQEYGEPNEALTEALIARSASVTSLRLYNWGMPADTSPLKNAVLRIVRGRAHVVVFTAARQVDHLLQVAAELGLTSAVRRALNAELVVGCIGPMTAEALTHAGIQPDVVPGHPKLGHLVLALARRARTIWDAKADQRRNAAGGAALLPPRRADV